MTSLLTPHIWWISALVCSLFGAAYYTINQYFKLPGITLVFWRGLIPFLVLTPMIFFVDWPTSPLFYAAACSSGFLCIYADSKNMQGSALFGGGVTTRLKPFTLWLLFALWLAFDPEHRDALFSNLPRFAAISATLVVSVYAASRLKKCEISKNAFLYFMPALAASVLINFAIKVGMNSSSFIGGLVVFPWIDSAIIITGGLLIHGYKSDLNIRRLFRKDVIVAGSMIGGVMIFQIFSKNIAMTYAENPAYVAAIAFLSPFWISLLYKLTGHKETADVQAGLLLVLSAIALVLLQN